MPVFTLKLAFLSLFFAFSLSVAPVLANGAVKVGDKIPHDLSLLDQSRKKRGFGDLKGKKGLVLVFVRSAQWCPFCQKQIIEYNKSAKEFKDKGYPVVTVSYDSVLSMQKFLTENKPDITMLSDPRSDSIRAFGILNEDAAKGTRSYGVPHPGVYIIDSNKKVQAKFFRSGYEKRPSAREVLMKIDQLNPKPKPKKPYVPIDNLNDMGEDPIIPGDDIIEVPTRIDDDTLSLNGGEPPLVDPLVEDLILEELMPEELKKTPAAEGPVELDDLNDPSAMPLPPLESGL